MTAQYQSILDEGYGGQPNDEYALQALPPEVRRKIKKERKARRDKWQKAHAARAENWTLEMFEEEEARLRDQIENWGQDDRAT